MSARATVFRERAAPPPPIAGTYRFMIDNGCTANSNGLNSMHILA